MAEFSAPGKVVLCVGLWYDRRNMPKAACCFAPAGDKTGALPEQTKGNNGMNYSVMGLIALLILLIENQDILLNRARAFDRPAWRVYRQFLIAVLVYYIADILWGVVESLHLVVLIFADTSLYFIAIAAGVVCWTRYAIIFLEEESAFGRFFLLAGRVTASLTALLIALNVFFPIFFTVDASGTYHALGARYAALSCQILLLLLLSGYSSASILRRSVTPEQAQRYRTVTLFGLVMAVFLFGQLLYVYLPLYSLAYLLGTSLVRAVVISDEKEAYRRELEETAKIAELKRSITALLDNMPAMSFSKDARTGAYLACNQAFADYARKSSPAEVVGLTDYDIFDPQTAAHFVADDARALGMEQPLTFFEDVLDAAGNSRQFQTTKLKFTDAAGRLCLLGMSTDVTEMVKTRKEREQAQAESAVYESMVEALSGDYFNLFYVDLDTENYIEYGHRTQEGFRSSERRGHNFFQSSRKNALRLIYEEDQKAFLEAMDKERMVEAIDQHGTFLYIYRLLLGGVPTYVSMKATRISGDKSHIIIGISNVDAQMRDRAIAQRAKEEQKAYRRFTALSGNVIVSYLVDLEREHYVEFRSTKDYDQLGIAKDGDGFFRSASENSLRTVHPEDQDRFLACFTRENVLEEIARTGVFMLEYRLLAGGLPTYVHLKAAMVEEEGKSYLTVGLFDVDAQVLHEQEYVRKLEDARRLANRDELTGVKNKHAYAEAERALDAALAEHGEAALAVVICDLNDLKRVNDRQGHSAGDRYIRTACRIICNVFKHSPVFRIGGDEFAVLCQGHDYEHIEALLAAVEAENVKNQAAGGVQIACGMSRYQGGESVAEVFERADREMYLKKAEMKRLAVPVGTVERG